jgi:hypothetical protein
MGLIRRYRLPRLAGAPCHAPARCRGRSLPTLRGGLGNCGGGKPLLYSGTVARLYGR